jgi:hypothetical protein
MRRRLTPKFAVCINNSEYPASLELHKICRVVSDEENFDTRNRLPGSLLNGLACTMRLPRSRVRNRGRNVRQTRVVGKHGVISGFPLHRRRPQLATCLSKPKARWPPLWARPQKKRARIRSRDETNLVAAGALTVSVVALFERRDPG